MIGIGINNINALTIPGYNRKAFATGWMSVGNAMPGKRFICVLYMSKVNPHQDFLLEIQSCDTKSIFDLNCRKVLEHSHLIDRSTLERILDADANGFELVEVQGRTLVRFKFLNLIEKRPSERIILHSKVGKYLHENGIEAALMLCYPNQIASLKDAERVRIHMEKISNYCYQFSEDGDLVEAIDNEKDTIEKTCKKIKEMDSMRNSILEKASIGIEALERRYGLQVFLEKCEEQHHYGI